MTAIIEGMTPLQFINACNSNAKFDDDITDLMTGIQINSTLNDNFDAQAILLGKVFKNISLGLKGENYINILNENYTLCNGYIFYVDQVGNDVTGDGSVSSPWLTLAYAASQVTVNEKIHLNAGTYTEGKISLSSDLEGDGNDSLIVSSYDGTVYSDGAITVIADEISIKNIKINGDSISNVGISARNKQGIVIDGVTITGCLSTDIFLGVVDTYQVPANLMYGLEVKNCFFDGLCGVWMTGIGSILMHNNNFNQSAHTGIINRGCYAWYSSGMKIYDNVFERVDNNNGEFNIGLELQQTYGGNEIYRNEFIGAGQYIDLGGAFTVKGNYEYSFKIYKNSFIREAIGIWDVHGCYGISCEESVSDVEIFDNWFENIGCPFSIALSTENKTSQRIRFHHNIAKNLGATDPWACGVKMTALYLNDLIKDIYIDNNVFNHSGFGQSIFRFFQRCLVENIYIRNNICEKLKIYKDYLPEYQLKGWISFAAGSAKNIYVQNNVVFDCDINNEINSEIEVDGYFESGTINSDPLYEIAGVDFHLQVGSPAINAGVEVGLTEDYEGNPIVGLPDIGVYEKQ